ncbi:MAG: class I SAM-dependent methyltransferase [Hyphomicrobiales bacterium]|nr:methyltransferase domain-containing protein [Hyphomicrobiales bacterium]MDE2018388.1 class I SAM-dependent methyltransferase [Hyphomicrobiales bacterium]
MASDFHPANRGVAAHWDGATTRAWADAHELIDRRFVALTRSLFAAAAPKSGERALDIGCGAGTTLLVLARAVAPGGRAVGLDISARQCAVADARIAAESVGGASTLVADLSIHDFGATRFDLAFSRFGVMFFADPVAAFAKLRAAMAPGGRLCFGVFRAADLNPWATRMGDAVRDLVAPPPPSSSPPGTGQFSWADPARVRTILGDAGWHDVSLDPLDVAIPIVGPEGIDEALDFALNFSPLARAMASAPLESKVPVVAAMRAWLDGVKRERGGALPAALWIVRARR